MTSATTLRPPYTMPEAQPLLGNAIAAITAGYEHADTHRVNRTFHEQTQRAVDTFGESSPLTVRLMIAEGLLPVYDDLLNRLEGAPLASRLHGIRDYLRVMNADPVCAQGDLWRKHLERHLPAIKEFLLHESLKRDPETGEATDYLSETIGLFLPYNRTGTAALFEESPSPQRQAYTYMVTQHLAPLCEQAAQQGLPQPLWTLSRLTLALSDKQTLLQETLYQTGQSGLTALLKASANPQNLRFRTKAEQLDTVILADALLRLKERDKDRPIPVHLRLIDLPDRLFPAAYGIHKTTAVKFLNTAEKLDPSDPESPLMVVPDNGSSYGHRLTTLFRFTRDLAEGYKNATTPDLKSAFGQAIDALTSDAQPRGLTEQNAGFRHTSA